MTINTAKTVVEGRTYEVVADSSKINEPAWNYFQVYRLRKDGSRGLQLLTYHKAAYAAWLQVRDQIKAAENVTR